MTIQTSPANNQIYGRQREIQQLTQMIDDTIASTSQLALLVGEPGIGKTRLVEELARIASSKEVTVAWGACLDGRGTPPHWPWIQILESLDRQLGGGIAGLESPSIERLARLLPGIISQSTPDSATGFEDEFTLSSAIRDVASRTATTQPTLLVLEDIHWADDASLQTLDLLTNSLRDIPLLIVATYRDTDVARTHSLSATLPSLTRAPRTQRLPIVGLEPAAINQIIESTSGIAAQSAMGNEIATRTAGNPFFAREIALSITTNDSNASNQLVPEGVREAVGRRLSDLEPSQIEILQVGSLVGRTFNASLISEVITGTTPAGIAELCESLTERGLLTESPDRPFTFTFSHSLIQETVASEISTSRRMRTHAAIASYLDERFGTNAPDRFPQIANHYLECEPLLGPDKVLEFIVKAAEHAFHAEAHKYIVELSERGIEIAKESSHRLLGDLLVLRARAGESMRTSIYSNQQKWDWQAEAFEHLVAVKEFDKAVDVALLAGAIGAVHGTAASLKRALDLVSVNDERRPWLAVRYGVALDNDLGDHAGAMAIYKPIREQAIRDGDRALEARVLAHSCQASAYMRRFEEGYSYGLHAITLATEIEEWASLGRTLLFFGFCTVALGTAKQHIQRLLDVNLAAIPLDWRPRSLMGITDIHLVLGNWELAHESLSAWKEYDDLEQTVHDSRVIIDLLKGTEITWSDEVEQELDQFVNWSKGGPTWGGQYVSALLVASRFSFGSNLHIEVQNVADALVARGWGQNQRLLSLCAQVSAVCISKIESEAVRLLPELESFTHDIDPSSGISVTRLRGLLQVLVGDNAAATQSFEAAISFTAKAEYWPEFVRSSLDYVDLLITTGSNKKAAEVISTALPHSERLEMDLFTQEFSNIEQQLTTSASSQPEPTDGLPDGLTNREAEVLRFVAAGHTNQQIADELFLSRYTVVRHVANIFAKTGAANRTEAATYANQNDLV
ncbi:MAG: AAA family ATPase [Chloroflexi bacterium]|jgi:DNA-binding CsgD family transcriptional regulator|nr:AAA family ATPase [Chloroflexota bacterium]MBT5627125.1 AAA family ATPase [Chloroflexota bacterium]